MDSATMPPPPTPFAHRRTLRLVSKGLPQSTFSSAECILHKMSLSKGATFHQSSSPPHGDDPVLSIPHLKHRSPTCLPSSLTSWLSEKEDVARSIADFEETFSGARGKTSSTRRRTLQPFEQQTFVHRVTLPSDEGLGSSISASHKSRPASSKRASDLVSNQDSGVGTSISDSAEKLLAHPSEDDGLAVRDLIQEVDQEQLTACSSTPKERRQHSRPHATFSRSAVTESIAPPRLAARHPRLSKAAKRKIDQHIITPILEADRFEPLHSLVTSLGSKPNTAIRCLRDLEQSLLFQPLTLAISTQLYRSFGEFTIQLVVDTYQQLSESDQRRASDRPYDNGYFLDLVQQVNRLASHIGSSEAGQQVDTAEDSDDMAFSADDEVTLEGGLDQTGNFAELVRWKNGKGISLRTGQPFEPLAGLKRHNSDVSGEDAARSMARRKKGYVPEIVEMRCSDKDCDKVFTRKCDLAKHEKTHSRPFKCPEPTCKYHEQGLPTEKERERHVNDKHCDNPTFYKCEYCEFKTKRESNCKQHMEKRHGWTYQRAKGKDKVNGSVRATPAPTPETPSLNYSASPAVSGSLWDDTSSLAGSNVAGGSGSMTPFDQPLHVMDNGYVPTPVSHSNPIFPRATSHSMTYQGIDDLNFKAFDTAAYSNMSQAYVSPTTTASSSHMMGTPITPTYSNITEPSPYSVNMDVTMDCGDATSWNAGLLTPNSHFQPNSNDISMSNFSPMIAGPSGQPFEDEGMGMDDFNYPVGNFPTGDFPAGDFALFEGSSANPFSNPAAANATLFPIEAEAFSALDDNTMFDDQSAESFFNNYMNPTMSN